MVRSVLTFTLPHPEKICLIRLKRKDTGLACVIQGSSQSNCMSYFSTRNTLFSTR